MTMLHTAESNGLSRADMKVYTLQGWAILSVVSHTAIRKGDFASNPIWTFELRGPWKMLHYRRAGLPHSDSFKGVGRSR